MHNSDLLCILTQKLKKLKNLTSYTCGMYNSLDTCITLEDDECSDDADDEYPDDVVDDGVPVSDRDTFGRLFVLCCVTYHDAITYYSYVLIYVHR